MTLHAKNIVMMTDAQGEEVEILVQRLVEQGTLRIDVAEVELAKLRNKRLWAFLKNLGHEFMQEDRPHAELQSSSELNSFPP